MCFSLFPLPPLAPTVTSHGVSRQPGCANGFSRVPLDALCSGENICQAARVRRAGLRKAKAHLVFNQARHVEGNEEIFFHAGQQQGLAKVSCSAEWGSFTGHRGYRQGGGAAGVRGLGLDWQELLSRDRASAIPWQVWGRESLTHSRGGSGVGTFKPMGETRVHATRCLHTPWRERRGCRKRVPTGWGSSLAVRRYTFSWH